MRRIGCEQCPIRPESCIRDLPLERLDDFHACGTSAVYRARQIVFHEGTRAEGLYILCHGAVKLFRSDRFGREHILTVAAPGDILGELRLEDAQTYSASAEAVSESQLCYLPRERLVALIQKHPMIGVRLVAALSTSLAVSHAKAGDLALNPAEIRLAKLLIDLADRHGEQRDGATHVVLPYSRREMAELIGVSTETAIRLLSKLRRKKLVSGRLRELVIADYDRLNRLAHHGSIHFDGASIVGAAHGQVAR